MTSVASSAYEDYPQYCFHLSPTINKWCPLRASDIQGLQQHAGFAGQDDIFFNLNHPIRWVRVVGVVVAVDEYYGRRIYTIDDSTGVCIECSVTIPTKTDPPEPAGATNLPGTKLPSTDPYPDVDIGLIVEVKGSLKLFRENKQINVKKLLRVQSSSYEVQFWNKVTTFRNDVLSQPWVLERRTVRKLRKEQEVDAYEKEKEKEKEKRKLRKWNEKTANKDRFLNSPLKATSRKPYRPSRLRTVMTYDEGRYDALGL